MFYNVSFLLKIAFCLVETKLEGSADPDELSHPATILVNVLFYTDFQYRKNPTSFFVSCWYQIYF